MDELKTVLSLEEKHQKRIHTCAVLFAVTVSLMYWQLCENVVPVCLDDAMYAGWTRNGLAFFLEKNIWHYNVFNGRVLVHLILQIMLSWEEHLYAIGLPLSLATAAYLAAELAWPDWSRPRKLMAAGVTGALFFCTGLPYLRTTVFWMAGGVNYVMPLCIVMGAYYLFRRERIRWFAPLALAFCAGATTEQYGMYAIGLLTMTLFFTAVEEKRKPSLRELLSLAAVLLGYGTIFLSPGTQARAQKEMARSDFLTRFIQDNEALTGKTSLHWVTIGLMVGFAILALLDWWSMENQDEKEGMLVLLPFSGVTLALTNTLLYRLGNESLPGFVFLIFAAMLAICYLCRKETREHGKLIVCGYGSFFMMLASSSASHRTAVPCLLSFALVLALRVVELMRRKSAVRFWAALLTCGILILAGINCADLSRGSREALQKYEKPLFTSIQAAQYTNRIDLDFDVSLRQEPVNAYRYLTVFDMPEMFSLEYYQDTYKFADDVVLHHTSQTRQLSDLYYRGRYSPNPVLHQNGKLYIPFSALKMAGYRYGGMDSFPNVPEGDEGSAFHSKDDRSLMMVTKDGCLIRMEDGEEVFRRENADVIAVPKMLVTTFFVEIHDYCDMTLDTWEYSRTNNTFLFYGMNEPKA